MVYLCTARAIYILVPLLFIMTRNNLPALLVISVVAHFMPATQCFMVDRLLDYTLYFTLGIITISKYDEYQALIDLYQKELFFLFIASFLSIMFVNVMVSKLIIGLCSIRALHGMIRLKYFMASKFLYILGFYVYSIYLMNTIAIGITKGVLLEFTHWDGLNFLFFTPCLLISGLVAPILIKKYIFIHIPFLNRITS